MLSIRDVFDACNRKASMGYKVIGAHIGSPSHKPPVSISELLAEMGEVGLNYLPFTGMDEAKEAVSEFGRRFLNREYEKDRIFITNGGAQALFAAALSSYKIRKGKMLVPAPGFVQYFSNSEEFSYPIKTYDSLAADLVNEVLSKAQDVSSVLINYPNNPTGYVPPNSVLRDLWDELRRRDILLINDAAYSQIYYGEPVEIVGDIVVDTFSKTFAIPGMRAGYVYWGAEEGKQVGTLIYLTSAGVSEVVQRIVIGMIEAASEEYFYEVRNHYRRLRDLVVREARLAGLDFPYPMGAFYLYAKHPKVRSSEELARSLLEREDYVVGIVPATSFNGRREWFRISYGRLRDEEIPLLFKIVGETAESLH